MLNEDKLRRTLPTGGRHCCCLNFDCRVDTLSSNWAHVSTSASLGAGSHQHHLVLGDALKIELFENRLNFDFVAFINVLFSEFQYNLEFFLRLLSAS